MHKISVYKKILRGGLTGIILGLTLGIGVPTITHLKTIKNNKDKIATDIADSILRFHIRANSDSEEDIQLKMTVRNAIVDKLMESPEIDSLEEAFYYVNENMDEIEEIARDIIKEEGYDYDVDAYITKDYFPIRQYGEIALPAGEYNALRIDIGAANGENFWCLLYPTLCYTVDSKAFITKEGEDKLEKSLDEEDYKQLFVEKNIGEDKIKVKFKILEWLGL